MYLCRPGDVLGTRAGVSDLHNAVGSAPATAIEDGAQWSTLSWDGCCSQHKRSCGSESPMCRPRTCRAAPQCDLISAKSILERPSVGAAHGANLESSSDNLRSAQEPIPVPAVACACSERR